MKTKLIYSLAALPLMQCAAVENNCDQPNVLIILSDDHSAPHLGCYGNEDIVTPNLDRFAEEGMRFSRAYAMSPQSSPNRASIMTGRSPVAIDMSRFYVPLDKEFVTVGEDLKAAGYFTGMVGRCYHLDGGATFLAEKPLEQYLINNGLKTVVDRMDYVKECPYDKEDTEHIHQQFHDFMDARDKSKPFFVELSYSDPHRPYQAEEFHNPDSLTLYPQYPNTRLAREDLAQYYDEIHRLDRDFGYIMKYLDENGLRDNTVVIFMGDNGSAQFRGKGTLYEWGLNVPFIIRYPPLTKAGSHSESIVSAEDITPTILDIVGVDIRSEITGVSLLPVIKDGESKVRKYTFAERGAHGIGLPTGSNSFDLQRTVIGEQYKQIYNAIPQIPHIPVDFAHMELWTELEAMSKSGKLDKKFNDLYFAPTRPMFELYDLENDPYEFNNLYGDPDMAEMTDELLYELSCWMIRERDFLPLPLLQAYCSWTVISFGTS